MPLGIVSNEDFEKELGNTVPSVIIKKKDNGRGKENNEVPNELRKIIGEEHVINGPSAGRELARQFGISSVSESAYANGSTSVKDYNKQPNLDFLNKARLRVSNRARKVLMKTLSAMEDDVKVNDAGLGELASAAKSMSGIMKDMEPQTPNSQGVNSSGPTIIFVAPHLKREDQYEVVRVSE